MCTFLFFGPIFRSTGSLQLPVASPGGVGALKIRAKVSKDKPKKMCCPKLVDSMENLGLSELEGSLPTSN